MSASAVAPWRRWLIAQGLAGPPPGRGRDAPLAVTRRLLAIQAQDPRGARLAIRARSRGGAGADVDAALTEDRSLVLTWLARGTLHLVAAEDYPLLQALTTEQLRTSNLTRLGQEGFAGPDAVQRGVAAIDAALADAGPLSAAALRDHLRTAGVLGDGIAEDGFLQLVHRASLDGVLVRGPMAGAQHAYARVADWLPAAPRAVADRRADRPGALAELTRRFLAGHGPADPRDLAYWGGISLGDARTGFATLGARVALRERPTADGPLWELPDAPRTAPLPGPRLLGAFEPAIIVRRQRSAVLAEHEGTVVTGGVFRAFGLLDGRAVATWKFSGGGGAGVALTPLRALTGDERAALDDEASAVLAYLGRG